MSAAFPKSVDAIAQRTTNPARLTKAAIAPGPGIGRFKGAVAADRDAAVYASRISSVEAIADR